MAPKKVRMICGTCGGTNVALDAFAAWNETTQEWELEAVFDAADCDDCGGETNILEVRIDR